MINESENQKNNRLTKAKLEAERNELFDILSKSGDKSNPICKKSFFDMYRSRSLNDEIVFSTVIDYKQCIARKTDPIQSDPIQSDPIQSDPIQSDPIQSDPIQSDPIKYANTINFAKIWSVLEKYDVHEH
jgi:hypothetical protein